MTLTTPNLEIIVRRVGCRTIYRAVNSNVWTYHIGDAMHQGLRNEPEPQTPQKGGENL